MIGSIQSLRGIAALLVVFYHAHGVLIKRQSELGLVGEFWSREQGITKLGAIGVDIFFVISGFIIFFSVWEKSITTRQFLIKRALRIYPIYWVASLGILVISFMPGSSSGFSTGEVIASFLLYPTYLDGQVKPILEVGWTLYYEMFFYIVFSVLLWQARDKMLLQMTMLFLVLVAAGLAFPLDIPLWKVATNERLLEFVAGAIIARVYLKRSISWGLGWRLASLSVALTGICSFVLIDEWREEYSALLTRGPAAIAIFSLCLFDARVIRASSGRIMQFLGDASYSIYLFHMFPLITASGVWKRGLLVIEGFGPGLWVILIAAGSIAGIFAHVCIEKPMMRYLKSVAGQRHRKATLLAAPD